MPARASLLAAFISLAVGAASLLLFFSRGLTNLLGDGVAHMEGARRLTDSLSPGYATIGTVWLPLYHLVVAPLAMNDSLWRTGLAGSLVSAVFFTITGLIVFRLGAEMSESVLAGAVAMAGFVICPSMAYIASTPLTEPMAILMSVLIVYGLFRYSLNGRAATLVWTALAAFAGTLTRYDGWFLLPFAALFALWASRGSSRRRFLLAGAFSIIAGLGPVLWLVHNAVRFGNPLEFYNGPGSALAIYQRQIATSGFRYPTDGSLVLSALYYLADLVVIVGPWALVLSVFGFVAWVADRELRTRRGASILLLVPFIFYVQSMAHSAVPLYVPILPPFSYYNLRYGLEALPALAVFPSFLFGPAIRGKRRAIMAVIVLVLIAGEAAFMLRGGAEGIPMVRENIRNNPCRAERQQALIALFRREYDGKEILMTPGEWICLNPALGIPFRKTLSETNGESWIKLSTGIPAEVGWIIRGEDDPVDQLMRGYPGAFAGFELVRRDAFAKEGWVEVYRRRAGPAGAK